jgi:rhodanese-related sulfurtransferase
MPGRRLFLTAAFVLAVLVIATPGSALFGPSELDKERIAVRLLREVQRGGYDVLTAEELKSWIDESRDLLIVDTMPYEASYAKQHIPGAEQFLFPVPEMEAWSSSKTGGKSMEDFKKLLGSDHDRLIVFYCGFVKCTRSHNGAMWAAKLGYRNVYRYPAGIKGWEEADYPIASAE